MKVRYLQIQQKSAFPPYGLLAIKVEDLVSRMKKPRPPTMEK
jgi:hypothetical protein